MTLAPKNTGRRCGVYFFFLFRMASFTLIIHGFRDNSVVLTFRLFILARPLLNEMVLEMGIWTTLHVFALLLLCICSALATAHLSFARLDPLDQRSLIDGIANGTTADSTIAVLSTTNSSKSNGNLNGTTFNLLSQNLTLNSTSSVAKSPPVSGDRRLIETSESIKHGYLTSNCDARTLGAAEAAALDDLLASVQANLRIVVNQAKKGIASKNGFQALFKSSRNSGKVAVLFAKIMNAVEAENDPEQGPITPLVICVAPEAHGEGGQGMETLYIACQLNPGRRAMQPLGRNLMLLCPSFWQLPSVPPAEYCPKKNSQGIMSPNEPWLQLNRQSVFVHEMAHMYLGHNYVAVNETYRVADAVALSEEDSLRNPSNYAFFYAGK